MTTNYIKVKSVKDSNMVKLIVVFHNCKGFTELVGKEKVKLVVENYLSKGLRLVK
jgi:hypothetical protein